MSGIEAAFFGALGRDAERKTSQAGRSYLRLNARVGDGDSVQWVSVMAFDEHALEAAEKFTKGARVYVEGRLSISEWIASDGAKRHGLSVMSWHCRLSQIGRNKSRSCGDGDQKPSVSARGEPVGQSQSDDFNDEIIPF